MFMGLNDSVFEWGLHRNFCPYPEHNFWRGEYIQMARTGAVPTISGPPPPTSWLAGLLINAMSITPWEYALAVLVTAAIALFPFAPFLGMTLSN